MTRRQRAGWIALITIAALSVTTAIVANSIADAHDAAQMQGALTAPPALQRVHAETAFATTGSLADWVAPQDMPTTGRVETVTIPATRSHFVARKALLYLPPAALVADAPRLPVVVAFGGQPGTSEDLVAKAQIPEDMDAIAAAHHGIAPIVVMPDQMGPAEGNPMCVDSKLGNAAMYLTVDVPAWIRGHLHVETDRHAWTVAGFSEGGTCSIQFAAGDPALFGSVLDVSGELAPRNGSLAHTIAVGFGGSAARYAKASPLDLLKAHGPFADTRAVFAVGSIDHHYRPAETRLAAAAADAGMTTTFRILPGMGHHWTTAAAGYKWGLDQLVAWWGV